MIGILFKFLSVPSSTGYRSKYFMNSKLYFSWGEVSSVRVGWVVFTVLLKCSVKIGAAGSSSNRELLC